jgi:hypothetical protein
MEVTDVDVRVIKNLSMNSTYYIVWCRLASCIEIEGRCQGLGEKYEARAFPKLSTARSIYPSLAYVAERIQWRSDPDPSCVRSWNNH